MRRTTRGTQKSAASEVFPDVDSSVAVVPVLEAAREGWMPSFRFVQSSPHAGETHVNGQSEVVHWVVKDRPFSIRVLEVPSVPGGVVPEGGISETVLNDDLAWSEVEVEADVVYTASHVSVKPSTGLAPLLLDRSVIPPNIYNHRRSANNSDTGTDPATGLVRVVKLKEGAGLELLVRLSILSSHLRNDFCLHLKLYIRHQLVASWFSETIRSVSKWDKVRHLQDSSSLPSSTHSFSKSLANQKPKNNSHRSTPAPGPMASASSFSAQVSQKPVSASISKADSSSMQIDDDDCSSTTSSEEMAIPIISAPSRVAPAPAPRSTPLSYAAAKYAKKKKASGEEVFDMLHQLKSNFDALERLVQAPSASKKRRATWDAAVYAYPTEEEAQQGAQRELRSHAIATPSTPSSQTSNGRNNLLRFKKFKLAEVADHQTPQTTNSASSQVSATSTDTATLANHANQFLHLIDTMAPSEVRNALSSVLLTRPDLASALARLMQYDGASNPRPTCALSCGQSIAHSAYNATTATNAVNHGIALNPDLTSTWPTADMMLPSLTSSSHILINQSQSELWNEERYGLGQEIAAGFESGACAQEMPSVMSQYAFDDDSTTMGSPSSSYTSWGDEWQSQPVSPFLDASFPQPSQLTDSSLFPAHLETDGF